MKMLWGHGRRGARHASSNSSSLLPAAAQDVQAVLARLDERLRKGAVANADDVMGDLRVLHEAELVVPQTFYIGALSLLTSRKDVTRTELLLRMSQRNLAIGLQVDQQRASRSRPEHDPFHKLVSFSVSGLLREGCFDDAMTLLVRMSSSGYVTSRVSLEKMLDRIANSGKKCPSIAFIDKINQTMLDNRWNRAPGYYVRVLKVVRQHILWSCADRKALDAANDRLDALWSQASTGNEDGTSADVELMSIRIQCLLLVVRMHRKLASPNDLIDEKLRNALDACRHLLNVGQLTLPTAASASAVPATDEAVLGEIQSLISDLDADAFSEVDVKGLFSATRKVPGGQKLSSEGLNHAWSRPHGQLRNAVVNLTTELAQGGSLDEALLVLDLYLTSSMQKKEVVLRAVGGGQSSTHRKLEAALSGKIGQSGVFGKSLFSPSSDKDWAEGLIGSVLSASGSHFARQQGDVQANIAAFAARLKDLGKKHDLSTKAAFYAAWIDALRPVPSPLSADIATHLPWEKAFAISTKIVDSLDESIGRSPAVYHALVSLLCRYDDPSAMTQVKTALFEMTAEGTKILPETFAVYINAAISVLGDEELASLLLSVEELILRSEDLVRNPTVLAARLRANARLCRGHKSLELLRALRQRRSEASLGGVERHIYSWVISALYLAWPGTDAEWRIASDPQNTCEYILQEMLRDGHYATSNTVAQLLKLYSKACQINRKRSSAAAHIIDDAETFMHAIITGGNFGHPRMVASEACIRELVKACCLAGQEERALAIIDKAHTTYGVRPTAASWEPLVFYYASKQGAMNAAEDVLTMMMNRGVPISDAITDAFVAGHLKQGDASEALDRIQDIFNQHGVRPCPGTFLNLLQSSLDRGDEFEARRVCSVIQQFYTAAERQQCAVWTPTTARALGVSYSESSRSSQVEGVSSPETLQAAKDSLDGLAQYSSAYRLRGGSGSGPVIRGALSDENLSKAFRARGLQHTV